MIVTGLLSKGNVQLSLNNGDRHDADVRANGVLLPLTVADMRNLRDLIDAALKLGEVDG